MDKLKKCTKKWNRETEEREGKKMQDEQKKFQEKLSELLSYARDHENKVTMKEVRDFLKTLHWMSRKSPLSANI